MDKLMQLAAKRAAKKRKRSAALRSKSKSRKTKPQPGKRTAIDLNQPAQGTIARDVFAVDGFKRAAGVFNEWLEEVKALGITATDGEGNAVQPIRISELLRRYK